MAAPPIERRTTQAVVTHFSAFRRCSMTHSPEGGRMRTNRIRAWVLLAVFGGSAAAEDYIYSDAFEQRLCDGSGCSYCSPVDPLPLCGTQSHCLPQTDGSSMCAYPAGAGTQGAACTSQAACDGPYFCADTGQASKCLRWCLRNGNDCTGGTTCVALNPAVFIGADEWGLCL